MGALYLLHVFLHLYILVKNQIWMMPISNNIQKILYQLMKF